MNSQIVKKIDTDNYKDGFVQCISCGWHKDLGDGFNQYHIDKCPNCSPDITTRIQNTVTVGRIGNYEVRHGKYIYFVIDGAIHIQFSGVTYSVDRVAHLSNR